MLSVNSFHPPIPLLLCFKPILFMLQKVFIHTPKQFLFMHAVPNAMLFMLQYVLNHVSKRCKNKNFNAVLIIHCMFQNEKKMCKMLLLCTVYKK